MFYIKNIILTIILTITLAVNTNQNVAHAEAEISFTTKVENWNKSQENITKSLSNKKKKCIY